MTGPNDLCELSQGKGHTPSVGRLESHLAFLPAQVQRAETGLVSFS